MNGLNIAQINAQRTARAKRGGSPYFTYTPGAINAAANTQIEIATSFPGARKYEPLDYIEIINNEAANQITVSINGSSASASRIFTVPARTMRIAEDDVQIWTVNVQNDGAGVTTAGNIIIRLKKRPAIIDDVARQ